MSANSCVQIKIEEDYDQVMIEDHHSCEDDDSTLNIENTSASPLNIDRGQQRDTGRQPTTSLMQTPKRWSSDRQGTNGTSQNTGGQGSASLSLTSSMRMEQEGESSLENDSQQLHEEESSFSKDSFGTDQLTTLGEILAYCQVMYGAIQKLDEKFDQLQAKVTNIQPIQLTQERFQKAVPKTQFLSKNTDPPAVSVNTSLAPDLALSMPHLVRVCSPPPPPSVEVKRPPALSPAPRLPSPPSLPSLAPQLVKTVGTANFSNHVIPLSKVLDQQTQSQSHTAHGASPKTDSRDIASSTPSKSVPNQQSWLGNKRRNVCISQTALLKAEKMSKPGKAARFLMRCVFSIEEMSCSNIMGDPTRGLKKLDPNKLSAIREWLARKYPRFDLKEKGKDWRKCTSIMNATARYLRLMAKRRRLKTQSENETPKTPDVSESYTEPIPEPEADPDPEVDQPTEKYVAQIEEPVENYTSETEFTIEEYTAEIDVELSESEEEDDNARVNKWIQSDEENSLTSYSDTVYEHLGNPLRDVKVPQFAMFTALQRTRPELAARVLIKYMFPEEVLVVSNVHGNNESGIQALDHNKLTALREHLQERFPWLLLEEDGQDWKVCVGAINSTIRKFRHDLKMGRGRKKGT
ncbi:BEN domain-containing protein 2 isoform X2 [Sardina pilchardus]|uniref:BEN domain-containing protein 2 isoform X2 n=1 Tax=Sardina pilchardus TaxID=27697 RepID=UPI002E16617B